MARRTPTKAQKLAKAKLLSAPGATIARDGWDGPNVILSIKHPSPKLTYSLHRISTDGKVTNV
jgi:hypothetical protein